MACAETLTPASTDPTERWGLGFFVVELSFDLAGKRGRLFLTCSVKDLAQLDDSYPHNRFLRIGPILSDQYEPQMALDVAQGKATTVRLKDGTELASQPLDPSTSACAANNCLLPSDVHPEAVFLSGGYYMAEWYRPDVKTQDGVWIYRTTITSQKPEEALMYPPPRPEGGFLGNRKTVYVNGVKTSDNGDFQLHAGRNDLVIVIATAPLHMDNVAFFCRIMAHAPWTFPPWSGLEPGIAASFPRITTLTYALPAP